MKGHPGGREHSLRMLSLSGLRLGRVLDMGAGAGESLELMKGLGLQAEGIDLCPRGGGVLRGDMLSLPYPEASFDGVMSQCSFYLSGDVAAALAEAHRVLRPGGALMLSDVCFQDISPMIRAAGFEIALEEDMSAQWREYYLEALWREDEICTPVRGKCRYMLYICRRV